MWSLDQLAYRYSVLLHDLVPLLSCGEVSSWSHAQHGGMLKMIKNRQN